MGILAHLAVLKGRHCPGIHVEIRIDLDGCWPKAHHLAQHTNAGGRHSFADAAQHAACLYMNTQKNNTFWGVSSGVVHPSPLILIP